MRFAKYHGTGNDFLMVEDLDDTLRLDPALIAAACDRHLGAGADGLIRILRGRRADFDMDYYNADGGSAEMCGNGIRCLAKYVYDSGLTSSTEIDVETRSGLKHLGIETREGVAERITVDMGAPSLERKSIPMSGDPDDRSVDQRVTVDETTYAATAVSMGNPHCVLFLLASERLDEVDVPAIGRKVERLREFPKGTNVEFAKVLDGRIDARVWERGSGETSACGTGACAVLVASSLSGLTGRRAEVRFPGGALEVHWREDDHVLMTGPAVSVYDGELDPAWLAEVTARGADDH